MSTTQYAFSVDAGDSLRRARAILGAIPAKVAKAERRAMRALSKWVERQVLRAASQELGVTQKALKAAARIKSKATDQIVKVWIGTNPVKAHFLGTVRWTPLLGPGSRPGRKPSRMAGARAGKRQFPGSWSWGEGSKTGKTIMRRTGQFVQTGARRRERIAAVTVPVHDAMARRLDNMAPEIAERFDTLYRQQLNYALNVEGRR